MDQLYYWLVEVLENGELDEPMDIILMMESDGYITESLDQDRDWELTKKGHEAIEDFEDEKRT